MSNYHWIRDEDESMKRFYNLTGADVTIRLATGGLKIFEALDKVAKVSRKKQDKLWEISNVSPHADWIFVYGDRIGEVYLENIKESTRHRMYREAEYEYYIVSPEVKKALPRREDLYCVNTSDVTIIDGRRVYNGFMEP